MGDSQHNRGTFGQMCLVTVITKVWHGNYCCTFKENLLVKIDDINYCAVIPGQDILARHAGNSLAMLHGAWLGAGLGGGQGRWQSVTASCCDVW